MQQNIIETIIGSIIVLITILLLFFAYNRGEKEEDGNSYRLTAYFQNIESLAVGDPVKLSGIKIGEVREIILQPETYFAKITLTVAPNVEIPQDSRAIISTKGLLGGNYVRINPGASEENLTTGQQIKFTQSALNIEDLIGKLMYSITSGK